MKSILSVQSLQKQYGAIRALNNVSFEVPEASVFGLLGPNGSGKTTLLAIILDVLQASGGAYRWWTDAPHNETRRQIGSLLETPNFYHYLSAYKNLEINAAIKGVDTRHIDEVLEVVKLSQRKHSAFSTFSLGMKQRLAIANALLGNPKVLVLDEPTNGLDPEGIAEIRELILDLNRRGITILIASHILDEIEKICTHAAVLKQGNLLLSGAVNEIFSNDDIIELGAQNMEHLENVLKALQGIKGLRRVAPKVLQVHTDPGTNITPSDINTHCFEKGIVLQHLQLRKKSLETNFIELTK